MKTVEITRHKQASSGAKIHSTWAVFADIYRREGIRGINKGVNAVAVRQCTNWGSRYAIIYEFLDIRRSFLRRMGFARLAEDLIRSWRGKKPGDSLSAPDKIFSATIGEFVFMVLTIGF
jgi:hypothetical protein